MIQRQIFTDPDLQIERIKSNIIKDCLGNFSVFDLYPEFYFIDIQNRFFFCLSDDAAEFTSAGLGLTDEISPDNYFEAFEKFTTSYSLPVLRAIYVCKHHRKKGLQDGVLEFLLTSAELNAEGIAAFADPFELNSGGGFHETNGMAAAVKFQENGYQQTENWYLDLIKQRNRFLKLGFQNCIYNQAQITKPFQHFAYIPSTAPERSQKFFDELEVFYSIDWEKLEKHNASS